MPFVAQILIRVPCCDFLSMHAKSPTTKAKRYVDMIGVVLKVTDLYLLSILCSFLTSIFDKAVKSLGTIKVTSKVAFLSGSSQQGKARLASVASN